MAQDEKQAAADKAAADKAQVEKAGATSGAESVAEAVKRVADAAVAEVKKTGPKQPAQSFTFSGAAERGRFEIRGKGFSTNGTVKINGAQVQTTEWGDSLIVGKVPEGVKAGAVTVEVAVDSDTKQVGSFTL